jgi:hypothetical protein
MASNPSPTASPPAWLGMLGLINGYQITQAIHVASVLGIAGLLKDGPRAIDELASATKTHPRTLYRLLRALAAVGVFHEEEDRRFSLTAMGDCLRPDSATPIGSWAQYVGTPYVWRTWCHLLDSVRTGENTFQAVHGKDVWHYRAEHPDDRATFDRAMTDMSRGSAEAVIAAYDFSGFRHVVDVGGGRGLMLSEILSAQPRMQGTLFDQPGVVAEAKAVLEGRGVSDRCRIIGGSFFEAVPEGGDAYVMRAIIHDWEDDEAIAILKVCRRAMRDDAKLLLIERLIAPPNQMPASKFSDLNMLVMPGGLERTDKEFSHLLAAGGFELTRIAAAGNFNVIEAHPR